MKKTQTQEISSNCSNTAKADKCIELLFSKFAAWYGHVWRSQYKDEAFLGFAKKEWQEGLCNFSEIDLNQAMISCRDHYELPPTLPQMIQCCRQIKRQNTFFVARDDYVPPDPEIVRSYLQQCKSFLTQQRGSEPC